MKDKNRKAMFANKSTSKQVSRRINVSILGSNSKPKTKKYSFTSKAGTHRFDDLKWARHVHANYTKYPNQGNNSYGKLSPLIRIKDGKKV